MYKYVYKSKVAEKSDVIKADEDDFELAHFDFSNLLNISLPKIDLPKFELPKLDLSKIKLPDIKLPNIDIFKNKDDKNNKDKSKEDKKDKKDKNSTDKKSSGKGSKYGREWKEHKWIARKRNADGKWIYDYGNGFPGEGKLGASTVFKLNKHIWTDKNIKLAEPGIVDKLLSPAVGLGQVLLGPSLDEKIAGGKQFLGSIAEGLNHLKLSIDKIGSETDPKSGLTLKKEDQGKEYDLDMANPGWENPDGGSQYNCPCCSVAYDMRRRGFDVNAKQTSVGLSESQIVTMYKDPVVHDVYLDKTDKAKGYSLSDAAEEQLSTEPDGSRGIAWMTWNGGGGHAVAYEIENGVPYIYDAQPGTKVPIDEYVDNATTFTYYRTDNLEPDYEQVKKVVE